MLNVFRGFIGEFGSLVIDHGRIFSPLDFFFIIIESICRID